jgi:magnesium transporter
LSKKKRRNHSHKRGLPPGSLVYVGKERQDDVKITVIDYNKEHIEERDISKVQQCYPYLRTSNVTWINISGIHDVNLVEKIGEEFGLHPLLLEDILNSDHRPKLSHLDQHLLVILKRLYVHPDDFQVRDEQISILLGENTVITFQENEADDFDSIRSQIKESIGDIRKLGADFLMYRIIDSIVDRYLLEIERLNDHIEQLEEEVVLHPTQQILHRIYIFKKQIIRFRKNTWPAREVIHKLEKNEYEFIQPSTRFYYSDIHEHIIQLNDMVETTRGIMTSLLDVYFSSVSHRMNEIMKVLTIVSTVFIPLTFIVGVYGMNFAFMPELEWHWGYPMVWGVMILLTSSMFIFFRKRKWI